MSRKSYGTNAPQAGDGNAVLQVVANDIVGQPPQPNQAILGEFIGDAFIEDGYYNQEIIDISDSQGDVDSLGSYNIEPEEMSGSLTPDGSGFNVGGIAEGVGNSYDHTNDFLASVEVYPREIINAVGDRLLNIAISYAERSDRRDS
ncbi:uncharacterized protein LOC124684154 [Lolium rigidum]|uniref:uncharacterized protein LOC124684154 n=1 Tax=Lolium rigidum TaxID=89674 RepID=UPI001F5D567E|nr:uncharacterized protein LOC124684154 [Lolium rigidum]